MKTRIIISFLAGMLLSGSILASTFQFINPVAGGTYHSFTTLQIQWTTSYPSQQVDFFLSFDGGVTLVNQVYYIPNNPVTSGTVNMLLPNASSTNCVIVALYDSSGSDEDFYDTSATFTIAPFPTPTLTVNIPHDTTICDNSTAYIIPQISGGQAPYTLEWIEYNPGASLWCNACDTLSYYIQGAAWWTLPQLFALVVTDVNGLTGYDTILIKTYRAASYIEPAQYIIQVSCDSTYTLQSNILDTSSTHISSLFWISQTTGDTISDSPTVTILPPAGFDLITLCATDQYGCTIPYDTVGIVSTCNTYPVVASNECLQLSTPDSVSGGYAYYSINVLANSVYDTSGPASPFLAEPYDFGYLTLPTQFTIGYGGYNPSYPYAPTVFILTIPVAQIGTPDSFLYVINDYWSTNYSDTAWVRINVPCAIDSGLVWPGDANDDGVVDNHDLLPIGIAYGTSGIVRPGASINWVGQYCADWADSLASGTNYKYSDCNGDGTVNANDTLAIHQNFFSVHTRGSADQPNGNAPALKIIPLQDTVSNGDTLHTIIVMGDSTMPVNNAYGVAFDINFNPVVVDTSYVSLRYVDSWLGTTSQLLSMTRYFTTEGFIKTAATRYDHINQSGYGTIATCDFLITTSNINGKNLSYYLAQLITSNIELLDNVGNPIPVNTGYDSSWISFSPGTASTPKVQQQNNAIKIFPNPAGNQITISSGSELMDEVKITDMVGRQVADWRPGSAVWRADISYLSSGLYVVEILTGAGKSTMRLAVSK